MYLKIYRGAFFVLKVFLFSFLCGVSIFCVLLGMDAVSWLEIRGMLHWCGSQWSWSRGCPTWSSSCSNVRAQFRWNRSSHHPCNSGVRCFQCPGIPQWRFSMAQLEFLPAAGWRAAVPGKPCSPTGHGVHISHPGGRRFVFHWNSCCVLCQILIFKINMCELSWFFNVVIIQPKTYHLFCWSWCTFTCIK